MYVHISICHHSAQCSPGRMDGSDGWDRRRDRLATIKVRCRGSPSLRRSFFKLHLNFKCKLPGSLRNYSNWCYLVTDPFGWILSCHRNRELIKCDRLGRTWERTNHTYLDLSIWSLQGQILGLFGATAVTLTLIGPCLPTEVSILMRYAFVLISAMARCSSFLLACR
jgi:hypothetical protein